MPIETVNSGAAISSLIKTAEAAPAAAVQNPEPVQAERVLPLEKTGSQASSDQELNRAIEQVQVMMDLRNRSVEFTTDESSGARVVKVVDSSSGDVIRPMPAEELLSFMRNLTRMLGTFIDKTT